VALVARVGRDARGEELVAALAAEGVGVSGVVTDAQAATGAALVMVGEGGEKQILVAPGANRRLSPADIERAADAVRRARAVLLQLEAPLETVLAALRLGRAAGACNVLDPAPAVPLPDELLALVDVIRPNAHEAGVIAGVEVRDRDSAREAARRLLDRGVRRAAAIGAGQGNLLVWRDGERWLEHLPVASVDATGAGDAFAAALAVACAEGQPWEQAGLFASAAAALATTRFGAQAGLPRRAEVLALMSRHGG
jgi:ribokinase